MVFCSGNQGSLHPDGSILRVLLHGGLDIDPVLVSPHGPVVERCIHDGVWIHVIVETGAVHLYGHLAGYTAPGGRGFTGGLVLLPGRLPVGVDVVHIIAGDSNWVGIQALGPVRVAWPWRCLACPEYHRILEREDSLSEFCKHSSPDQKITWLTY